MSSHPSDTGKVASHRMFICIGYAILGNCQVASHSFRRGGGGGGCPEPPLSTTGGGGFPPLFGSKNENIFQILLSFQLK